MDNLPKLQASVSREAGMVCRSRYSISEPTQDHHLLSRQAIHRQTTWAQECTTPSPPSLGRVSPPPDALPDVTVPNPPAAREARGAAKCAVLACNAPRELLGLVTARQQLLRRFSTFTTLWARPAPNSLESWLVTSKTSKMIALLARSPEEKLPRGRYLPRSLTKPVEYFTPTQLFLAWKKILDKTQFLFAQQYQN